MSYKDKQITELGVWDTEQGAKDNLLSYSHKEPEWCCPLFQQGCDVRCVNYEPPSMLKLNTGKEEWRVYKGYCTNGMFSDYRYVEMQST